LHNSALELVSVTLVDDEGSEVDSVQPDLADLVAGNDISPERVKHAITAIEDRRITTNHENGIQLKFDFHLTPLGRKVSEHAITLRYDPSNDIWSMYADDIDHQFELVDGRYSGQYLFANDHSDMLHEATREIESLLVLSAERTNALLVPLIDQYHDNDSDKLKPLDIPEWQNLTIRQLIEKNLQVAPSDLDTLGKKSLNASNSSFTVREIKLIADDLGVPRSKLTFAHWLNMTFPSVEKIDGVGRQRFAWKSLALVNKHINKEATEQTAFSVPVVSADHIGQLADNVRRNLLRLMSGSFPERSFKYVGKLTQATINDVEALSRLSFNHSTGKIESDGSDINKIGQTISTYFYEDLNKLLENLVSSAE